MRAGLSTIQQTLTPEAATVLNHSISEASRRNHGQTTPLHVAATLLSSPSGYLRQACIRSHPNSSHPLQCRALELCFSVALERLPTAQNMLQGTEPPISNALMAALKRAQAHQRRGCPEQQQQPLLAVKVELEQLIISILDDPSVSRVMREASFSSPAVKNTIEQSLTQTQTSSSSSHHHHHHQANYNLSPFTAMAGGVGGSRILGTNPVTPVQMSRNMYLNPKLQGGGGGVGGGQLGNLQRGEEVKRVMEILLRNKKRNPVLVGEGELESVVKEVFNKIEKGELCEGNLNNLQVVQMDKEFSLSCDKIQMLNKITELQGLIESKMSGTGGGVILDLGDLKWLVEQQQQQQPMISEIGKAAVTEMGKLLARFREEFSNRLWLIGTATCETYLRCQVYHSTMENDWDLQAVPIASRSPHPGIFPRLGNERILGSSLDTLNPLKSFTGPVPSLARRVQENVNPRLRTSCCPQCKEKFEHELAKLVSEFENSSSEAKSESPPRPQLPQWLQSAKLKNDSKATTLSQDQGLLQQKTQELQKKWNDTCLQLHPNFQHNVGPQRLVPPVLSMPGLHNPNLLLRQPLQPKLVPSRSLGVSLQLNTTQMASQSLEKAASPPGSPVRTDLVLGPKPSETAPEKTLEDQAKDFLSCISSVPQNKLLDKFASALDADTFKRLLKGLMEKAWWQQDAASSVASAVSRCRLGNGKQRGGAPKGDIWLLFTGPDRYAKRKMASVLAEQMCGNSPIMISLGSRRDDEESDVGFRGKTAVDRIAEAVRRNPLSVIMLEDIDEANVLVRGSIKRAMDRGRLTDSHGREISLGNVIFILTGNWSTMSPESYRNEYLTEENKLVSLASSDWQLRLTVGEKSAKRRASWLHGEDRPRKELNLGLSFDLNEAADLEDYRTDGSYNSSDLTVEREEEPNRRFSVTSVPHELISSVDDTIPFKPIEFQFARREIKKTISKKFSMVVVDDKVSIEVEDDIVDRILGGLWRGRTSLEQWVEKVLGPSFDQIQPRLPSSDGNAVVRLQLELQHTNSNSHNNGECLPSKVTIVADGQ